MSSVTDKIDHNYSAVNKDVQDSHKLQIHHQQDVSAAMANP